VQLGVTPSDVQPASGLRVEETPLPRTALRLRLACTGLSMLKTCGLTELRCDYAAIAIVKTRRRQTPCFALAPVSHRNNFPLCRRPAVHVQEISKYYQQHSFLSKLRLGNRFDWYLLAPTTSYSCLCFEKYFIFTFGGQRYTVFCEIFTFYNFFFIKKYIKHL
jgi:hypothetical protein